MAKITFKDVKKRDHLHLDNYKLNQKNAKRVKILSIVLVVSVILNIIQLLTTIL